ncbi:hypothetical protein QYF61_004971 [Mycteria americana]|uniref:Uncharacterized protein n=1 Tax=Mycteria americana TaxID=33587 RepID=A0AAN7MW35_MYCAM|nr:hypothetical protein QYF61_004971 [Mycteria americana]
MGGVDPTDPVSTAGPCGGAPTPGVAPRCPQAAPPPLPTPPPLPPDCLPGDAQSPGDDVTAQGTNRPGAGGAAWRRLTEAAGDATTVVGPVATSPGGDKVLVATQGDVIMEGTEEPGVTNCSGDTLGHVTMVYREATTVVGPIATSQGGDNLMVATHGDVTVEGTAQPGVTQDPGDALGHVTEVYREATTVAGPIATSQGGDKFVVAAHGDVTTEETEEPDVTDRPGDTLGLVTTVYREATTVVGPIATSQGGDNLVVGTHGDVTTEGKERPSVTNCSEDTLGHVAEVNREATTVVGPIATSQGGDKFVVAAHGDVTTEETEEPDVTDRPGDTLGRVTMVYREATTVVGPIAASQGGDKFVVAAHGDVTTEETEEPDVTDRPGDTLGLVTTVYREATTVVGPIATSQGGDNLVVGTHGDVTTEGKERPSVTNCSEDTLGHVAEVNREATTVVGPIATSQGGDKFVVAAHGDVTTEETEEPDVTDRPGDTLGRVTMVYREATTVVGPIAASQGGDKVLVATHGDVTMEGTERPVSPTALRTLWATSLKATERPPRWWDPLPRPREVTRSWWAPRVTSSWRGPSVPVSPKTLGTLWATLLRSTERPPPWRDPSPRPREGQVCGGRPWGRPRGGDNRPGTEEPGVTQDPGDALGHVAEVYREATTVAGPIATSQGGDNLMVAAHGDVLMEGTEEPGVTNCSGDTLGHVATVYREATTVAGPIATSQGGDNLMVGTHGDETMEGTERPVSPTALGTLWATSLRSSAGTRPQRDLSPRRREGQPHGGHPRGCPRGGDGPTRCHPRPWGRFGPRR